MERKRKQSGMTLPEILTSIVIVALLAALTLPAVKAIFNSFGSVGSAEAMINAAMSNARAMAMREQRYVGVRFQKAYNPDNSLNAAQYIIFIINDPQTTTLANGFRAVEGMQPIKLPQNIEVMDLRYRTNTDPRYAGNDIVINSDTAIEDLKNFNDTTTFSIIFSPTGQLVIHNVRVRNNQGKLNPANILDASDDIFNSPVNISQNHTGLFVQDDYIDNAQQMSFGEELSRRQFVICEQDKFKRAFEQVPSAAYTGYLSGLSQTFINSYSGTIISK